MNSFSSPSCSFFVLSLSLMILSSHDSVYQTLNLELSASNREHPADKCESYQAYNLPERCISAIISG